MKEKIDYQDIFIEATPEDIIKLSEMYVQTNSEIAALQAEKSKVIRKYKEAIEIKNLEAKEIYDQLKEKKLLIKGAKVHVVIDDITHLKSTYFNGKIISQVQVSTDIFNDELIINVEKKRKNKEQNEDNYSVKDLIKQETGKKSKKDLLGGL